MKKTLTINANTENDRRTNYPKPVEHVFEFTTAPNQQPERIDVWLTQSIRNASRNKVQKAIEESCVTINGKIAKSGKKIQPNDYIVCKILKPPPIELIPENIPLRIVYEDEWLLVVDKPAGMVTHPGHGNRYGTLVNALLYHFGFREILAIELDDEDDDEDSEVDEGVIFASPAVRPGIVHRLDKDTSGLLLIAKNPEIHAKLAVQFSSRTIDREYNAIVWGNVKDDDGLIEGNIGRSSRNRKAFAVVKKGGKPAATEYHVLERFNIFTFLKLKLHTGRTHQIRVHLSNIGYPVLGDEFYGGNVIARSGGTETKKIAERCLKIASRQMLHARTLGFIHPVSKEKLFFQSELPEDMKEALEVLRNIY